MSSPLWQLVRPRSSRGMFADRSDTEKKLKVFISYSRKDIAFAQRILAALETRGLAPIIDTRDLPELEDWRRELLGFIREADAIVFIVSPRSISSPVCSWEVDQVAKLNKRLAPIVLERVSDDRIPDAIAKINYLFFDPPCEFELQADALARALQTDLAWLKEHTRFGELARHWDESGKASGSLLRGRDLLVAEQWIASRPRYAPEPTELHREFIAQGRRNQSLRRNVLTAGLTVGLAVAVGLAGFAFVSQQRATQSAAEAREQLVRSRAALAEQLVSAKSPQVALATAVQSLPQSGERPNLDVAHRALFHAVQENHIVKHIELESQIVGVQSINGSDRVRLLTKQGLILDVSTQDQSGQNEVWHLGKEVECGSFSQDGNVLITTSDSDISEVWSLKNRAKISLIKETPKCEWIRMLSSYSFAKFSPDARYFAVSGQEGRVTLWQVDTGEKISSFDGPVVKTDTTDTYAPFDFSPDGALLVVANRQGGASIWNLAGRHEVGAVEGQKSTIKQIVFSPDGAVFLTTASEDGSAILWSTMDLHELSRLGGLEGTLTDVSFTHDNKEVILTNTNGTARIWSIEEKKFLHEFRGRLLTTQASPDSRWIVSTDVYEDGPLNAELWRYERPWDPKLAVTLPNASRAVFFDRGSFFALLDDKQVDVVSTEPGDVLKQISSPAESFTFSDDGRSLALALGGRGAEVINFNSGEKTLSIEGGGDYAYWVAISPTTNTILLANSDNVWLRSLQTGDLIWKTAVQGFNGCALPKNEENIAISENDGISLRSFTDGHQIAKLPRNEAKDLRATVSEDGNVVTASEDGIKLWSRSTGKFVKTISRLPATEALFLEGDKRLAALLSDGTVAIFSVEGERILSFPIEPGADQLEGLAASARGDLIAIGGFKDSEYRAYVFSTITGATLAKIKDQLGLTELLFSPDGTMLAGVERASEIRRRAVQIWSSRTGQSLAVYSDPLSSFTKVAFVPETQEILIGTEDDWAVRLLPKSPEVITKARNLIDNLGGLTKQQNCDFYYLGACDQ